MTTFRFVPRDLRSGVGQPEVEEYLNGLNKTIQADLERGGEAFVSNAVMDDRYLLRACIVNFRTGPSDIAVLPAIVVAAGHAADRPSARAGLV